MSRLVIPTVCWVPQRHKCEGQHRLRGPSSRCHAELTMSPPRDARFKFSFKSKFQILNSAGSSALGTWLPLVAYQILLYSVMALSQ